MKFEFYTPQGKPERLIIGFPRAEQAYYDWLKATLKSNEEFKAALLKAAGGISISYTDKERHINFMQEGVYSEKGKVDFLKKFESAYHALAREHFPEPEAAAFDETLASALPLEDATPSSASTATRKLPPKADNFPFVDGEKNVLFLDEAQAKAFANYAVHKGFKGITLSPKMQAVQTTVGAGGFASTTDEQLCFAVTSTDDEMAGYFATKTWEIGKLNAFLHLQVIFSTSTAEEPAATSARTTAAGGADDSKTSIPIVQYKQSGRGEKSKKSAQSVEFDNARDAEMFANWIAEVVSPNAIMNSGESTRERGKFYVSGECLKRVLKNQEDLVPTTSDTAGTTPLDASAVEEEVVTTAGYTSGSDTPPVPIAAGAATTHAAEVGYGTPPAPVDSAGPLLVLATTSPVAPREESEQKIDPRIKKFLALKEVFKGELNEQVHDNCYFVEELSARLVAFNAMTAGDTRKAVRKPTRSAEAITALAGDILEILKIISPTVDLKGLGIECSQNSFEKLESELGVVRSSESPDMVSAASSAPSAVSEAFPAEVEAAEPVSPSAAAVESDSSITALELDAVAEAPLSPSPTAKTPRGHHLANLGKKFSVTVVE